MADKRRAAAVCAAVILALSLLFSLAFIAAEADHDCGGAHCAVCRQIQMCQALLEQLEGAVAAVTGIAWLRLFLAMALPGGRKAVRRLTPVCLKVKLLN